MNIIKDGRMNIIDDAISLSLNINYINLKEK